MPSAVLINPAFPSVVYSMTRYADSPPDLPSFWIIPYEGVAYSGWVWDGTKAYPPVHVPTISDYTLAMQSVMDSFSQSWGYDDIKSAVTYVGDPYEKFNKEGLALRNWRSAVWVYGDNLLAFIDPKSPPPVVEVVAGMPAAPVRPVVQ